jgi:hypothetical protein
MRSKGCLSDNVPLYLRLSHPDLNIRYLVIYQIVATNTYNAFVIPAEGLANFIKSQSNLIRLIL